MLSLADITSTAQLVNLVTSLTLPPPVLFALQPSQIAPPAVPTTPEVPPASLVMSSTTQPMGQPAQLAPLSTLTASAATIRANAPSARSATMSMLGTLAQ